MYSQNGKNHYSFDEMPEQMKNEIQALLRWRRVRFPNGSNYSEQYIAGGDQHLPSYGKVFITTYVLYHGDNEYALPCQRTSVGPGNDLGEYFCTRDQALTAFLKS